MKYRVGRTVKIFDDDKRGSLGVPAEVVSVTDRTVGAVRRGQEGTETFWATTGRSVEEDRHSWILTADEAAEVYRRDILMSRIEAHGLLFETHSGRLFTLDQLARLAGLLTDFRAGR